MENMGEQILRSSLDYISYYEGDGKLRIKDGSDIACRFGAFQLKTGSVVLICHYESNYQNLDYFSEFEKAVEFEGITNSTTSQKICSEGSLTHFTISTESKSRSKENEYSTAFRLQKLKITPDAGNSSREECGWLAFGITNFTTFGSKLKKIVANVSLNHSANEEKKEITIKPLEKFSEIYDRIKITRGVDITAEIRVPVTANAEVESITDGVNDICMMLSVAQGCKVNWLYRDTLTKDGGLIERLHGSRITAGYSPFILIDTCLRDFIERNYTKYKQRKEQWRLDRGVIDGYLEAKQESDLLETRSLKTATSMERIRSIANYGKLNFKNAIRSVLNDLKLEIPDDEVGLFKECRDSLVHDGYFYCRQAYRHKEKCPPAKTYYEEYLFMLHFLDRIVLGTIGYTGHYVNCQEQPYKKYAKLRWS